MNPEIVTIDPEPPEDAEARCRNHDNRWRCGHPRGAHLRGHERCEPDAHSMPTDGASRPMTPNMGVSSALFDPARAG
jgi:hypothetical protein